jgi:hypothetical protein
MGELNQFDFVAVGVFDEGDDACTMFHRAGFAGDFAALGMDEGTGFVDVFDADRDVAIGGAEVVVVGAPVVGEFEDGGVGLFAVANEGQGEFPSGIVFLAQEFHAEDFAVEGDGAIEVADAQHGVEESHGYCDKWGVAAQRRTPTLEPSALPRPYNGLPTDLCARTQLYP